MKTRRLTNVNPHPPIAVTWFTFWQDEGRYCTRSLRRGTPMKRLLVKRLSGFLGAVAIGMVVSPGDTPAPSMPSYMSHAPIHVHRNDDGSLARGRNSEIET